MYSSHYTNHADVHEAQAAAGRATHAAREAAAAAERIDALEDKVDRLALICQAFWELMSGINGFSEQSLMDKVEEIDGRDGQVDGKATIKPPKCPKCSKPVSRKSGRCMYCGTKKKPNTAFESISFDVI